MPPRTRITRDMVVDAALQVVRTSGAEKLNARSVAAALNCSTQPVMYHFSTIAELRQAVRARADRFHTEFLLRIPPGGDPLPEIGLNYIRFAVQEPHLFRFLLHAGQKATLREMIDDPALVPVLEAMGREAELTMEETKEVILTVAVFTHGYACLAAYSGLEFDEKTAAAHLEQAFLGAVLAAEAKKGGSTP